MFLMCVIRRIIAYLCLNMINFDAVDFSEHRPEEVMFLLTLSVYQMEIRLHCVPWLFVNIPLVSCQQLFILDEHLRLLDILWNSEYMLQVFDGCCKLKSNRESNAFLNSSPCDQKNSKQFKFTIAFHILFTT